MQAFFDTPIEFLKGVGPQKAALINKELSIFTYKDLLFYFPFRYEDRTKFYAIKDINDSMPHVQVKGIIKSLELVGTPRKQRLVARLMDDSGELELVWFQGAKWISGKIQRGVEYIVFGKPNRFGRKINITHPEIDVATRSMEEISYLQPVYPTTEKLKQKYLDSRALSKVMKVLIEQAYNKISEILPPSILDQYALIARNNAFLNIHFPANHDMLNRASYRLKFEELFMIQLQLFKMKTHRQEVFKGKIYKDTTLLNEFYKDHLPFDLTNAQKRVIKEIYYDLKSGKQMNRLLQGDVGSGKTIVAFICMLLVASERGQAALMAPTEILAIQHYNGLLPFVKSMGLRIALLTGSSKTAERKTILQMLKAGDLNFIVGTHALIEDRVQFKELGLAIVDEQHRFGVAQRSKLWQKNKDVYPHVLVMTATPIPRTLAMTFYGDLDISTIDELPAGRKPIKTIHKYDANRLRVNAFLKEQIAAGRQIYIVYPLIEESEKLDLKDLVDGYESIQRAFPNVPVSIVHGKMKGADKEFEMQRFLKNETKIMVATTVIEVGVNVPNASVMIIENAERFGLAQLHQLRGRVGRGAEQSYCILITDYKLSKEARVRIDTMVRTNNGFEIADVDLKLRGPGDLMGTQQSGIANLKIADIAKDGRILKLARQIAAETIENDPGLEKEEHKMLHYLLDKETKAAISWSRIS
ncbi:MAG: ATP-dependent DNA helicase RecG [Candidatus Cyclobacteriaceae bacterium M2_1C_046]